MCSLCWLCQFFPVYEHIKNMESSECTKRNTQINVPIYKINNDKKNCFSFTNINWFSIAIVSLRKKGKIFTFSRPISRMRMYRKKFNVPTSSAEMHPTMNNMKLWPYLYVNNGGWNMDRGRSFEPTSDLNSEIYIIIPISITSPVCVKLGQKSV